MNKNLTFKAVLAVIVLAAASFGARAEEKKISSADTVYTTTKTTTIIKYGLDGVGLQMTADRVDFNFLAGFHFGWGVLPTKNCPEYDNNIWKSFIFEWSIAQLNVRINDSGSLYATGALNMSWSNIVWDDCNKRLLDSEADKKIPVFDYSVGMGEKSKIRVDYLGLPLGITYDKDHLKAYGTISAEVLTAAKTKFKSEDGKELKTDIKCANKFRSRIEVGVTYHNIGLYASYCLTPMFRSEPNIHPVNFGIIWQWN